MVDINQNAALSRDKLQFFSSIASIAEESQIDSIDLRVQNMGYSFILESQNSLETEFAEMFAVLRKKDGEDKKAFWLYCYYCASLLETFHHGYSQEEKAKEYQAIREQIKQRLETDEPYEDQKTEEEPDDHFIDYMYHAFIKGFRKLTKIPYHLSQIRDYVVFCNLCRIYWVFCRLTLVQGFTLAGNLKLIEQLDAFLGTHTDVAKIIAALQAPTFIINYFSVGFFLARFVIDAGMLIKHTFFPTEIEGGENSCELYKMEALPEKGRINWYRHTFIFIEDDHDGSPKLYYITKEGKVQKLKINDADELKDNVLSKLDGAESIRLSAQEIKEIITPQTGKEPEKTTAYERFIFEIYKRYCNFTNDQVWALINFLSNFNYLVGISDPVAAYLTATFLVFDMCMVAHKYLNAKKAYWAKREQYEAELAHYEDLKKNAGAEADKVMYANMIDMLKEQIKQHDLKWEVNKASFYFAGAAATILMTGFTASLLVNPAALILGCYFFAAVGVAMYRSGDAFTHFMEKYVFLSQLNTTAALKEYEAARNEFIWTLTLNVLVPMVFISLFAISWQAAVTLTALYLGYKALEAYGQFTEEKEARLPDSTKLDPNDYDVGAAMPEPVC